MPMMNTGTYPRVYAESVTRPYASPVATALMKKTVLRVKNLKRLKTANARTVVSLCLEKTAVALRTVACRCTRTAETLHVCHAPVTASVVSIVA